MNKRPPTTRKQKLQRDALDRAKALTDRITIREEKSKRRKELKDLRRRGNEIRQNVRFLKSQDVIGFNAYGMYKGRVIRRAAGTKMSRKKPHVDHLDRVIDAAEVLRKVTLVESTGVGEHPVPQRTLTEVWAAAQPHYFSAWDKAGSVTPDYRRRVKLRIPLPVNRYSISSAERQVGEVQVTEVGFSSNQFDGDVTTTTLITGQLREPSTPLLVLNTTTAQAVRAEAIQAATSKAIERIGQNPVAGGVILAESFKTARSLVSVTTRLAASIRAIKTGRFSDAFDALAATPPDKAYMSQLEHYFGRLPADHSSRLAGLRRLWLEMRYAWRPLMYDVKDLAEKAAAVSLRKEKAGGDVVTTRTQVSKKKVKLIPYGISPFNFPLTGVLSEEASCRVTCRAVFRLSSPGVRTMQQMGLTNLAGVAWEVTPFSFMADWFLPVADWLEYHNATAGLEFVSGYMCVKVTGQTSGQLYAPPGASYKGSADLGRTKGSSFDRLSWVPGVPSPPWLNPMVSQSGNRLPGRAVDTLLLAPSIMDVARSSIASLRSEATELDVRADPSLSSKKGLPKFPSLTRALR